jgi:hypothetical protein
MLNKKIDQLFQDIPISKIRLDGGTQPRAALDTDYVTDLTEDLNEGASFPPVILFFDGKNYWLADGFHRLAANKEIGNKKVSADVRSGTRREAVLHSVGANAVHGYRRKSDDKRRSVIRLLSDAEWSQWSNRHIARQCGVSEGFVRQVKSELSAHETQINDDYALRFGIDQETLNKAINRSGSATSERVTQRGHSIYKMDTENIGKENKAGAVESQVPPSANAPDIFLPQEPVANSYSPQRRQRAKDEGYFKGGTDGIGTVIKTGDHWSLGLAHQIMCCKWDEPEFQKILPRTINVFLNFPPKANEIKELKDLDRFEQLLVLASPYSRNDIDLMVFRLMIQSALEAYTNGGDIILISPLPDPALFILCTQLDIIVYCAEPDPKRCQEAISAWNTSANTFNYSPAKSIPRKGKKITTIAR